MTLADPTRCQYVGNDIGDDDTARRCPDEPTHWTRRETRSRGEHILCFCKEHIQPSKESDSTPQIGELPLPDDLSETVCNDKTG